MGRLVAGRLALAMPDGSILPGGRFSKTLQNALLAADRTAFYHKAVTQLRSGNVSCTP